MSDAGSPLELLAFFMAASTRFRRFRLPAPLPRGALHRHRTDRLRYALILRASGAIRLAAADPIATATALRTAPATIIPPVIVPPVIVRSGADISGLDPARSRAESLAPSIEPIFVAPVFMAPVFMAPAAAIGEPTVAPPPTDTLPIPAASPPAEIVRTPDPPEVAPPSPGVAVARAMPAILLAGVVVAGTLWTVGLEWWWLSIPPERRITIARSIVDEWGGAGAYDRIDAENASRFGGDPYFVGY